MFFIKALQVRGFFVWYRQRYFMASVVVSLTCAVDFYGSIGLRNQYLQLKKTASENVLRIAKNSYCLSKKYNSICKRNQN